MINKIVAFLVMLVCGTCGACTVDVAKPADTGGITVTVPPEIELHADVDFTPEERADLNLAAEMWSFQSDGLAKITIVYDLDANLLISQAINGQDLNLIVRVMSTSSEVAKEDCRMARAKGVACGGPESPHLLGYVSPSGGMHNPWKAPLLVEFVADSCGQRLRQIALHEFGHILGIPHQSTVSAIMYPTYIKHDHVCLKQPDLAAFCSVNQCGNHVMHPCE